MRQTKYLRTSIPAVYLAGFLLCALLIAVSAPASPAQSGRKPTKREGPPAGVQGPAQTEPPLDTSKPDAKKPALPILVVGDVNMFNSGPYIRQVLLRSCADRLKESAALSVNIGKEMNRKDASDLAKNSKDTHVLWLEMDMGLMTGAARYDDYGVNYVLYTPGTGKSKTNGRVHLRRPQASVGGVGLPLPVPSGTRSEFEYSLRQAGRDTADRVLSMLALSVPPDRR